MADMLTVMLPADELAMHTAIDNVTISELAEFMHGEDDLNAIWDVFVGNDILNHDGPVSVAAIEAQLHRNPQIGNEIRTIMHSTIDRGPGRASVELRVAGTDFVVAGGLSWGGEPYDGWQEDCSLAALLTIIGAGVPTELPTTP